MRTESLFCCQSISKTNKCSNKQRFFIFIRLIFGFYLALSRNKTSATENLINACKFEFFEHKKESVLVSGKGICAV